MLCLIKTWYTDYVTSERYPQISVLNWINESLKVVTSASVLSKENYVSVATIIKAVERVSQRIVII
jgi:hypothetical protein